MKRWMVSLVAAGLTLAACSSGGGSGSPSVGGPSSAPPASSSTSLSAIPEPPGLLVSIVGVDGTVEKDLGLLPADAWELSLSADGKAVAYVTWDPTVGVCGACSNGASNGAWLAASSVDGSSSHVVTLHGRGPTSVRMPAWSPDGTRIAFVSGDDIYVVGVDDSGGVPRARRLTTSPGTDEFPAWSADGKTIVYDNSGSTPLDDSGLSDTQEIWSVPADGGRPVRLTHNRVADQAPTYSPDGRELAFFHDGLIGVMDAAGGAIGSLPGDLHGWSPRWSPDGSRIAFLDFQGSRGNVPDPYSASDDPIDLPLGEVQIADVATGNVTGLGILVPSSYNPVSWLPSGDAVLANRYIGATT